MKFKKPTAGIVLDSRRPKKDGTYPLKLRITFDRDRKYYGIGSDLTEFQFSRLFHLNIRGELKELQRDVIKVQEKAELVFRALEEREEGFSFMGFEALFFEEDKRDFTVGKAFQDQIKGLEEKGKISSASLYRSASKSINDFLKGSKARFSDISPDTLFQYQKWMIENGNSISTVGIYLRNFRHLFNRALAKGVIKPTQYPFGKFKYKIPSSQASFKGLSKAVIAKLFAYETDPFSCESKAKDLWFFLYLSNGMNPKDLCRLKYSNMDSTKIVFKRSKSLTTSDVPKEIVVPLHEHCMSIIRKWGNPEATPSSYIFPYFYDGIRPEDERKISQNLTRFINKYMQKVANNLKLNVHITTYSARQSHSDILKEQGVDIKLISNNLGHSSIQITEKHYLSDYQLATVKTANEKLLNF